jgi:hypothetical protein
MEVFAISPPFLRETYLRSMKKLLLTLLAGCTSGPEKELPQRAIAALCRTTIRDSASYQPVRWGQPLVWTRGDSAVLRMFALRPAIRIFNLYVTQDSAKLLNISKLRHSKESFSTVAAHLGLWRHLRDSLQQLVRALPALEDTTQLGYQVRHTFRYRNSQGRLALDSIDFYVDRRGKVKLAG